jgi:hypothetical protein
MGTLDATQTGRMFPENANKVQVISFSRTLTAAESTALGSTGVIQLCDVEAGFLLLGGAFNVITAGTADCNGQIGLTGGDTDGFMAAADMDATGATQFSGALLDEGYLFTADDTIDLLFDTAAPGTLSYEFYLVGVQLYEE